MLACLLNDGVTLEELFPAIIPFTNFMSGLEKRSYLNLKYGNAIFEVSWNKEWFYIKFFHSIHIKSLNLSQKSWKIILFFKEQPQIEQNEKTDKFNIRKETFPHKNEKFLQYTCVRFCMTYDIYVHCTKHIQIEKFLSLNYFCSKSYVSQDIICLCVTLTCLKIIKIIQNKKIGKTKTLKCKKIKLEYSKSFVKRIFVIKEFSCPFSWFSSIASRAKRKQNSSPFLYY